MINPERHLLIINNCFPFAWKTVEFSTGKGITVFGDNPCFDIVHQVIEICHKLPIFQ